MGGRVVVDGFAGCGGNIVALARSGAERVIAVDHSQAKLDMVKHNAAVYGVEGRVTSIRGNFFDVAPRLHVLPR